MHKPSPTATRVRSCAALCLLLCTLSIASLRIRAQQPSLVLQIGHDITTFALSPDGRFAVTGSFGDGNLKWWDRKTGLLMRSVVAHDGMIAAVSFDASGGRVLSGGADGFVRVWDAASGRKLLEFRATTGLVKHVAFSPRGDLIATGIFGFYTKTEKDASGNIRLWDARTGGPVNNVSSR